MNHPTLPMLAASAILLCLGCSKSLSSVWRPDGREREWVLPHGEAVKFSHEHPGIGSDHAKYLDVRSTDGKNRKYAFAQGHSGYNRVDLVIDPSQMKIWLVDADTGNSAFLDLATREFRDEGRGPPIPPGSLTVPPR